jgi:hypothetical protein
MVRASDLKSGESVKLILTGEPWENEHKTFGKWYKWPVTLLKGQRLHEGTYDEEFASLSVGTKSGQNALAAGLMAAYEDPAYQYVETGRDGKERTKVMVTIARTDTGNSINWNVTPHTPGSGGGSTAAKSGGSPARSGGGFVSTNRIRAAVYVEAVNALTELIAGEDPVYIVSALIVAKDIVTHYIMSGATEGELLQGVLGAQRSAEADMDILAIMAAFDIESDVEGIVPAEDFPPEEEEEAEPEEEAPF